MKKVYIVQFNMASRNAPVLWWNMGAYDTLEAAEKSVDSHKSGLGEDVEHRIDSVKFYQE